MAQAQHTYRTMLQDLLPRGAAWPRDPDATLTRLLDGLAAAFVSVDERGDDLLRESDPRMTYELLPDWERAFGLPDPCLDLSNTLQERRQDLLERVTGIGGQSIGYFLAVAAGIGYADVTITEFRPFVCGVSRCGDRLNGPPEIRLLWVMRVPGPRVTRFRTGASQIGDRLGEIDRATDLECLIRRLAPAHTDLLFSYEGS